MRTELEGIFNDETLLTDLDDALPKGSTRELTTAGRRRIVIMVTKEAHCLGDILMKAPTAVWMSKSRRLSATTICCLIWSHSLVFRSIISATTD